MRDFIAFVLLMACLIVAVTSIVALIRPLPKLRLGTRKRAVGGIGVAFGLFILTAIVIPPPTSPTKQLGPEDAPGPTATALASAAPVVTASVTTPRQDKVISFARNVVMQALGCKGAGDYAQDQIDKVAANRQQPIEAYDAAKAAIKSCADTSAELERADVLEFVPAADRAVAKAAVDACNKAAKTRGAAMKLAQEVLDGDTRLATGSKFRELRDEASSQDTICRMNLHGVAERSKIPASEVDFIGS